MNRVLRSWEGTDNNVALGTSVHSFGTLCSNIFKSAYIAGL